MTTYNTGNPIGSTAVKDLYDNAENFDVAINDVENPSFEDRFGRQRTTLKGYDDRFSTFLASSGYQFLGDYAAGIEITEYNQILRDADGEFWRLSGEVELPYTTTGAGLPEDDALIPVGDAVLRQELANPDMGAALVGFSQVGDAPANTVQAKLENWVSVLDYCTPAQRQDILNNVGSVDVSDAWQKAFDLVAPNGQIDLGGGTHSLALPVSMSSKSRVRVIGKGARVVQAEPSIVDLVTFTGCHRLRFEDAHFVASETYAYFEANTPTVRRAFVRVNSSENVRIKDITGEKKRGHIVLLNCNKSIVEGADFVGFFPPLADGAKTNGNECPMVLFDGGKYNTAVNCHAENHGSCVLWGLDGIGHSAMNCTGTDLHDNGVYGSSGTRARVLGCSFDNVNGSGVKVRGSQNIAFGNTTYNCGNSIAISGNGLTPDAYGANGFGNIAVANSGTICRIQGIGFADQDGFWQRDSIVALNTVDTVTSTGGYGAYRGAIVQGGIVFGNVATNMTCDYGIQLIAPASFKQKGTVVFGNSVSDLKGSQQGVRLGGLESSFIAGNVGVAVAQLIQARDTHQSAFMGNVNPNGSSAVSASAANVNTGNLFSSNRGVVSINNTENAALGNYPAGGLASIAVAPVVRGLMTINSGKAYIAMDTTSPSDWQEIPKVVEP